MKLFSFFKSAVRPSTILTSADGRTSPLSTPAPLAPRVYVLSRAACGFSRRKLIGEKSTARRAATLQAAAKLEFPNVRARAHVGDDGTVGVWTWNGDLETDTGVALSTVRVIPESVARVGLENGARLVNCIDGVEGEIWRNGVLAASRWWAKTPTARDWLLFLRAGRMAPDDATPGAPTPVAPQWRDDLPLIDRDPDNLRLTFSPSRVAAGVGLIFLFFCSIETARIISYNQQQKAFENRLETAARENQDAYNQRRRARAMRAQIDAIADVGDGSIAPNSLLSIAEELPAADAQISNFRIYDSKIEVRVTVTEEIDDTALVRQLEAKPLLKNVFVERRQANLIFVRADIASVMKSAESGPARNRPLGRS